jgi:hypothetical protein
MITQSQGESVVAGWTRQIAVMAGVGALAVASSAWANVTFVSGSGSVSAEAFTFGGFSQLSDSGVIHNVVLANKTWTVDANVPSSPDFADANAVSFIALSSARAGELGSGGNVSCGASSGAICFADISSSISYTFAVTDSGEVLSFVGSCFAPACTGLLTGPGGVTVSLFGSGTYSLSAGDWTMSANSSLSLSEFGDSGADGTGQDVTFSITGVPPQPVPEPFTWTLMVTGIGFLGLSMRMAGRGALAALRSPCS